jgi:hypothetical protein
MEQYERMSSIRPAGVVATASRQRGSSNTGSPSGDRLGGQLAPREAGWAVWGGGEGSGRQGCESSKVEVLVPSIACIRTASTSGACRGNEARSARM